MEMTRLKQGEDADDKIIVKEEQGIGGKRVYNKEKSSKQGLTSNKVLTVMLPESRDYSYHRSNKIK